VAPAGEPRLEFLNLSCVHQVGRGSASTISAVVTIIVLLPFDCYVTELNDLCHEWAVSLRPR